jgi:hypothetical protein
MFPMRYELHFYIPEDGILHGDRRESIKSYRFMEFASAAVRAP